MFQSAVAKKEKETLSVILNAVEGDSDDDDELVPPISLSSDTVTQSEANKPVNAADSTKVNHQPFQKLKDDSQFQDNKADASTSKLTTSSFLNKDQASQSKKNEGILKSFFFFYSFTYLTSSFIDL